MQTSPVLEAVRLGLAVAVASVAAGSIANGGDVLEVGPGQPFVTIQAAVDAASSGDIVLIDPGTYVEDLTIDLGVTVVGRNSATVIDGYVEIGPLSGSQTVLITSLWMRPTTAHLDATQPGAVAPVIDVRDCRGGVRFQDLSVHGVRVGNLCATGGAALRCSTSRDVLVGTSNLVGGSAGINPFCIRMAGPGIVLTANAVLEIERSLVRGGTPLAQETGAPGGDGVRVETGARFFAYSASIEGGPGGEGLGVLGGPGGDGLVLGALAPTVLQDTFLGAGSGGSSAFGLPGSNGAPLSGPGTPTVLTESPRQLVAPAVVLASDPGWSLSTTQLFSGETSSLSLSFGTGRRYAPVFERPLYVLIGAPGTLTLNPVTADPAGLATVDFGPTVPPSGEDGAVVWSQALCRTSSGEVRFSASRATVLLGPGFN